MYLNLITDHHTCYHYPDPSLHHFLLWLQSGLPSSLLLLHIFHRANNDLWEVTLLLEPSNLIQSLCPIWLGLYYLFQKRYFFSLTGYYTFHHSHQLYRIPCCSSNKQNVFPTQGFCIFWAISLDFSSSRYLYSWFPCFLSIFTQKSPVIFSVKMLPHLIF